MALSVPVFAAMPANGDTPNVSSAAGMANEAADATDLGDGMASWFGDELAGQRTASGSIADPDTLTAAHRDLPFGSHVRVTNLANGEDVVVTITDRGPYARNRVIDLSRAAAEQIGLKTMGHGQVDLALLSD